MLDFDDPYWWTQDQSVTTLTFVEGTTETEMAAALDGTAEGVVRRLAEFDPGAIEIVQGRALHRVQVAEQGQWTVLVEPTGFAGVYEPLVPRLSRGRRQVALYCNVNAVMTFLHAVDGIVTRRFDPLLHPDQQHGDSLPEESGLVFGWDEDEQRAGRTPDPFRQALTLVERLTGIALTSPWLFETPRPVYLMPADPAKVTRR